MLPSAVREATMAGDSARSRQPYGEWCAVILAVAVGVEEGERTMSHETWRGDEAEGGPEYDDRLPQAAGELYDDPDLGDDSIPDEEES
jgi:hypothetical protein